MDDTDDDFGELYADVEVQACSAVIGEQSFTQSHVEGDDNIKRKDHDSIGDLKADNLSSLEAVADNVSDSEDDLNIVLNDNDDAGLAYPAKRNGSSFGAFEDGEVKEENEEGENGGSLVNLEENELHQNRKWGDQAQIGGSEQIKKCERVEKSSSHFECSKYKYFRHQLDTFSSKSKGNGSSVLVRDEKEDMGYNPLKASSCVINQKGFFSLPWYRTILDVNIDSLERKPWRHPGADIADYFNFGFDEDSWKHYCHYLDQHWQQTFSFKRIPALESLQPNKVHDYKPEKKTVVEDDANKNFAKVEPEGTAYDSRCREQKKLELPIGKAIWVENSISERQPSMDVRRRIDRDSDVVIQITVQDSKEDSSGSLKENLGNGNSFLHEASETSEFGLDDGRSLRLSSASEDGLPSEHLEEHSDKSDTSVPIRCPRKTAVSDPLSVSSNSNENICIPKADGHSENHAVLNICSLDDNTKRRIGRDAHTTVSSFLEGKVSNGEEKHRSQSFSWSGSQSEAFSNGTNSDPEKSRIYSNRTSPKSATELQESVASDYYNLKYYKSNCAETKFGDCKYYTRNRSHFLDYQKHRNKRDGDISELKTNPDYEDAPPFSETRRRYSVQHLKVVHRRQKEKLHINQGENFSHEKELYQEFNPRHDYQVEADCSKNPNWEGCNDIRDEIDRHHCKNSNDGRHFLEQRTSRMDDEIIKRSWHPCERELTIQNSNPLNFEGPRQLSMKYSEYSGNERGTRWTMKQDDLQFRKRMRDESLLECNYNNDFMREKFRRSIPYHGRNTDSSDYKHEKYSSCTNKEVYSSGITKRRCDSPAFMDHLYADGLWGHVDHQSRSYYHREPHVVSSRRWHGNMSLRNDVCKRRGRHQRQKWSDCAWFGTDVSDAGEMARGPDNRVHFGRRKQCWQYEVSHRTEDNVSRHIDDRIHAEGASFAFERSKPKRFGAKLGFDHAERLLDDRKVVLGKFDLTREGNNYNQFGRSSNFVHRDNHEQTLLQCRDSVDLHFVVGEGKSSGRCTKAGSRMFNGWHENMYSNTDFMPKPFNEYSTVEKLAEADDSNSETKNDDVLWLDKFPVKQHSEALDIEEGQILAEDVYENPVENIGISEDVAQDSDVKKQCNENATNENETIEGCDNHRILEMITKMEKRRERFKEPITVKKEADNSFKAVTDSISETAETKQQRPARKRRWGGS